MINISVTRLRRFRWFVPVLLVSPLLLLWGVRKVAQERPHFVVQENLTVQQFFFPQGGDSVCTRLGDPNMSGHFFTCWDRKTWKEMAETRLIPRHSGLLHFFHFGPDPSAAVSYYFGTNSNASLTDGYKGYKHALAAFSTDGKRVTLAASDSVSQWDLKTGKRLWTTPVKGADARGANAIGEGPYRYVADLSPDGVLCAIHWGQKESDSHLAVMDCRSGKIIARLPPFRFYKVAFTANSQALYMCDRNELRVFDARIGKPLWQTMGQFSPLSIEPRFTPDGSVGILRPNGFDFLDARSGELKRHLRAPALGQIEAWNFSPDGKQLWWSNPKHQIFYRDLE